MMIDGRTARGKQLLEMAQRNEGDHIFDVYGSVSKKKYEAWKKCKEMCEKDKGEDFRIISHNSFQFSVAWNCYIDGQYVVRIITKSNDYIVSAK